MDGATLAKLAFQLAQCDQGLARPVQGRTDGLGRRLATMEVWLDDRIRRAEMALEACGEAQRVVMAGL